MDHRSLSSDFLMKKVEDLNNEIQNAVNDRTLTSTQRYELLVDLRSIRQDILGVLGDRGIELTRAGFKLQD